MGDVSGEFGSRRPTGGCGTDLDQGDGGANDRSRRTVEGWPDHDERAGGCTGRPEGLQVHDVIVTDDIRCGPGTRGDQSTYLGNHLIGGVARSLARIGDGEISVSIE